MLIPTTPASAAGQASSGIAPDATRGALIGAMTKFPFPTVDELRAQQANVGKQAPAAVRLPVEAMLQGGGVVDSTLSERGQQLVAVAAKAMGLDAGEAQAAAELPPVFAVIHPEPTLAAELAAPVDAPPGVKLIQGEVGKLDADIKIVEAPPAKPARRAPMQMVQRLRVMELVRAAPADKPDVELATEISMALDRAVGSSTIAGYRRQLGLASVKMPSKAELQAKLRALEAKLQEAQQPTLQGVPTKT